MSLRHLHQINLYMFLIGVEKSGYATQNIYAALARHLIEHGVSGKALVDAACRLTWYSKKRWPLVEAKLSQNRVDLRQYHEGCVVNGSESQVCADAAIWAMSKLAERP